MYAAIGTWRCPSGNTVEARLETDDGSGVRRITLAWDSAPPLRPDDEVYYLTIIRPAIIERTREYLESPSTTLVLSP